VPRIQNNQVTINIIIIFVVLYFLISKGEREREREGKERRVRERREGKKAERKQGALTSLRVGNFRRIFVVFSTRTPLAIFHY
jgi:hypothetical protein